MMAETSAVERENYTKVVMQKTLCVPLLTDWQQSSLNSDSPDLAAWGARQEAERERIRKLDHTPQPPERPPKKLHLLKKIESGVGEVSNKSVGRIELLTPRPFTSNICTRDPLVVDEGPSSKPVPSQFIRPLLDNQTAPRHKRIKPAVPPKPKFCATSGTYTSGTSGTYTSNVENVKPLCDDDGRRSITDRNVLVQPASPANDPNLSAELEMHLQNAENGGGREGREEEREKLIKEREELLDRMKEKVRILREDEQEVEADMQAVRMEGERLVGLVEEQSSFVEGDKVRVHLQEVERLVTLLRVLKARLDRTEKMFLRTQETDQKEELEKRKSRLEEQMAEAAELKKFRDKRGKAILVLVESLLTSEERENYVAMLEKMVRVVAERKEVEEKITRGELQIQALTEALR